MHIDDLKKSTPFKPEDYVVLMSFPQWLNNTSSAETIYYNNVSYRIGNAYQICEIDNTMHPAVRFTNSGPSDWINSNRVVKIDSTIAKLPDEERQKFIQLLFT